MPSTVGLPKQRTDAEVITAAAQLEYDCVAAYSEAAKKARLSANADDFATMAKDCAGHLKKWQARLEALGADPAVPNGFTEYLNRLKVDVVGAMLRDRGIVCAVRNNSADSCEAYERVKNRADLQPETLETAAELLRDAQRHRDVVAHMPHKASKCAASPAQV